MSRRFSGSVLFVTFVTFTLIACSSESSDKPGPTTPATASPAPSPELQTPPAPTDSPAPSPSPASSPAAAEKHQPLPLRPGGVFSSDLLNLCEIVKQVAADEKIEPGMKAQTIVTRIMETKPSEEFVKLMRELSTMSKSDRQSKITAAAEANGLRGFYCPELEMEFK
jgi:hypothetical protein